MQQRSALPATRQPSSEASASLARRLAHLSEMRGTDAIPELRTALSHPDPWVRMHVVEGLAGIDHADARAALASALHDESFGVHLEAPMAAFPALAGLASELVTETSRPEPWYRGLNRRRVPRGRSFAPVTRDDTTP
jgi:HEAT repeat protein